MTIRIRKSRPEDATSLADLWHEMAVFHARQDPYWRIRPGCKKGYASYIQEVAKAKDKAVFVAHNGGKIVGFILVQLASRARVFVEKDHGLIVDLAVAQAYRRQGIGEKLLARATRWFKSQGVDTIEVRVATANSVSTGFWKKMGFDPYMVMNKKRI
jgi:ribosomal protein S18 acetylase RimI-like enzyme